MRRSTNIFLFLKSHEKTYNESTNIVVLLALQDNNSSVSLSNQKQEVLHDYLGGTQLYYLLKSCQFINYPVLILESLSTLSTFLSYYGQPRYYDNDSSFLRESVKNFRIINLMNMKFNVELQLGT